MSAVVIKRRPLVADPLPDCHPVVARVLAARGVASAADIDPSLAQLLAPGIAGLDAAVSRLARAVGEGEPIVVVGDFDADGATSTAFAVRALRLLGHERVSFLIPNRFDAGYGLTPALVDRIEAPVPAVVLTVDNGVSSHDGIEAAAARGIDVVVTDHHLPPPTLPPATAVVNPNRPDCDFASKNLAGVGVIFYVLAALRSELLRRGAAGGLPSLAELLDLVALGTIADVVPLDHNNRILVEQGLRRLRAGRGTPGVVELLRSARRDPRQATASDLAYGAAPRLNAAGRLADMSVGVDALLAADAAAARPHVAELESLNRDRRDIESTMKAQADAEVERLRAELDASESLPAGLVLHDERWHQGVSGILAGRLRQLLHRPVVILASDGEAGLRGSCRSIPGLHIRDVLAHVDARHPGLIAGFGGHAMAAGLAIGRDSVDAFRAAFTAEVERVLGGVPGAREIFTDGPLAPGELTQATAEALRTAAPWGAGFPAPSFDGIFRVRSHSTVGGQHLKMQVAPAEAGEPVVEAIAFHAEPHQRTALPEYLRLVYRLEVNTFRGRRSVQLVVEHMEPVPAHAPA